MIKYRTLLKLSSVFFITLFTTVVCHAASNGTIIGQLEISHAWVRAAPPNVKNAAAFMIISNHGMAADRLIIVSSKIANKTELHNHINDKDVMRMRKVSYIPIPAHGDAELKPGSYHIMFKGLKKTIKEGDIIIINLKFANAGDVILRTPVIKDNGGHKGNKKNKHKHN